MLLAARFLGLALIVLPLSRVDHGVPASISRAKLRDLLGKSGREA
jgi:hypothetical protein